MCHPPQINIFLMNVLPNKITVELTERCELFQVTKIVIGTKIVLGVEPGCGCKCNLYVTYNYLVNGQKCIHQ